MSLTSTEMQALHLSLHGSGLRGLAWMLHALKGAGQARNIMRTTAQTQAEVSHRQAPQARASDGHHLAAHALHARMHACVAGGGLARICTQAAGPVSCLGAGLIQMSL